MNTMLSGVRTTLLSLLLLGSFLFAQETGRIAGNVIDGQSGESMIGANVYLEGTTFGAATDMDGNYVILNVPVGSYELVVAMIGYAEMRIQNVEVKAGETTKLDVTVQSEVLQTETVTVQAKALQNTEGALLGLRQKAASVSDAISAEEISKSGSGDAAAAMKKVTGASVVGGKYVYIRGLGERYSATTLNGAELPSADPDKKSFQLDLIPSNMLDNINTIKTFTPDKPGTFTGGLVDVSLKSYPEKLTFQVNSSVGYNSVATFNNDFILGPGGSTDWMGFDDGTREMPTIFEQSGNTEETPNSINRIYRDGEEAKALELASTLDRQSRAFSNNMIPVSADAPMNSSFGISLGNTVFLDETQSNSFGYFGSMTWGQNYSFVDNGETGRYKLNAQFDEAEGLEAEFKGNDIKGSREVNWGSIANFAFRNSTIGQVKFSYMHTQSAESQGRYLEGYRERDRSTPGSLTSFETRVISWVERSLDNYQLDGEHAIAPLLDSKLDWKVSYSNNQQYEPDQRYFFNVYIPQPDSSYFFQFDGANSQPISRYYRDLEEDNLSTQLNLSVPFKQWSGLNSKLKLGVAASNVERTYDQRRFDYAENGVRMNDFHASPTGLNVDSLFSHVGIVDSSSRPDRPNRWYGMYVNELIDSTNMFSGDMETFAYYAMLDMPLSQRLRFIGGARVEAATIKSKTADPEDPTGNLDNTDVLPSVNLVYALTENVNLRTAYSKTIARPTFRELAPYISFEFVGDYLFEGNANLERTLITNYDLRWEWFMEPGEIIAVSGFYKDFQNPIEQFIDPNFGSGDGTKRSVKNVDRGRVYGIEFELRKGLDVIHDKLSDFKVGTNLSVVNAEVDVPEQDYQAKIDAGESNPDKTRPFPGQSPFIFNLNLTYENYQTNTNAGFFYNLFGDRLYLTGTNGTPDVYEAGFGQLDFKATQGIGDKFSVSLAARNLLNPAIEYYYPLKNDVVDKEFIYSSYKRGVSYSLSLSYKL